VLQSFVVVSLAYLFKYYVVVIMYLSLDILDGGLISPIKSTTHLSNTYRVTCGLNGISSLLDGFRTL
jgi:hypothetical protein